MLMTLLSIPVGYSQQGILSIDAAVQGGEGGHKEVYRYIENKNSILQWRRVILILDKEKDIIDKFTRVTSIKSTKQQSVTDKTTQ